MDKKPEAPFPPLPVSAWPRALGERPRLEQGHITAASIVEHALHKWLAEEGRKPVIVPADTALSC